MPDIYRHLKFGSICASQTQANIIQDQAVLRGFLNSFQSMDLHNSKEAHFEVYNIAKAYIGKNFRHWLLANYHNGSGARKDFVATFVNYVNGKVPGRTVITQLKNDTRRIPYLGNTVNGQLQTPIVFDGRSNANEKAYAELDFSQVHDYHVYDLFALVGPQLLAQLILSLDGISNE